jgi:hypothetical protein
MTNRTAKTIFLYSSDLSPAIIERVSGDLYEILYISLFLKRTSFFWFKSIKNMYLVSYISFKALKTSVYDSLIQE